MADQADDKNFFGYSMDPTISGLEDRLSELAIAWRDSKEYEYVEEYHRVFQQLKEAGWNGSLDPDSELPVHLMPKS